MEGDKEELFTPFTELCDQASSRNSEDINPQQLVFSPRAPLMSVTRCPTKQENFGSSPSRPALSGQRKQRITAGSDSL